jgi:hypothetical protein
MATVDVIAAVVVAYAGTSPDQGNSVRFQLGILIISMSFVPVLIAPQPR